MRQSGGLSLARPMQDCLHQKHLAICRIANSIAPPSATPIFLQCKNANERKRVTKKQPRGCFFACPMEIRRLAMRQSGGLSLARPMPDCLHQKHSAICRIANSIAPPSATPVFLQCKNANERKRVTKKFGNQSIPELFLLFSVVKNPHFEDAFFLVSNPLVTAKLPFIKGSPLLFSCVADVGKAADKPRGILN